jgi:hypothetical protein
MTVAQSLSTSLSVRDVPLNTLTQGGAHRHRISLVPVSVYHNDLPRVGVFRSVAQPSSDWPFSRPFARKGTSHDH